MQELLTLQINDYYVAVFIWNIFLALIPCFIAYRLSKGYYLKKWKNINKLARLNFLLIFLVWFFFFPNTAYLFTDIRHLVNYCETPGFYNTCPDLAYIVPIFLTYAMVGIPTFYYALSKMSYVLGKLFGAKMEKRFPLLMIPITGIGLLLGLFARFNSWEVITKPFSILITTADYLMQPVMLANLLSYTIMMYLIYYFIKATYKK